MLKLANQNWIAFLLHYDLKELRRRQEVNRQQLEIAAKLSRPDQDELMFELQMMADSLIEAILLKG